MTQTQKNKASIEAKLSRECGFPVELTVRGEKDFTLSSEGRRDFRRAVKFLSLSGRIAECRTEYDAECDFTCCYLKVA